MNETEMNRVEVLNLDELKLWLIGYYASEIESGESFNCKFISKTSEEFADRYLESFAAFPIFTVFAGFYMTYPKLNSRLTVKRYERHYKFIGEEVKFTDALVKLAEYNDKSKSLDSFAFIGFDDNVACSMFTSALEGDRQASLDHNREAREGR